MTEHPTRLIADINDAVEALTASGKPRLAKAVLQLRDLRASQDLCLEAVTAFAERAALKSGEPT